MIKTRRLSTVTAWVVIACITLTGCSEADRSKPVEDSLYEGMHNLCNELSNYSQTYLKSEYSAELNSTYHSYLVSAAGFSATVAVVDDSYGQRWVNLDGEDFRQKIRAWSCSSIGTRVTN